jgi:hypothetical protein
MIWIVNFSSGRPLPGSRIKLLGVRHRDDFDQVFFLNRGGPVQLQDRLENWEDITGSQLSGRMNIHRSPDLGIDQVVYLHDSRHDANHFVKVGIIEIKNKP